MRVLLIALQQTTEGPASPAEQTQWTELGAPMRTARLEEDHALALAAAMRDGGRLAPMLLCAKNSRLHRRAAALNLPTLAAGGPVDFTRLWLWQRRHKHLLVQTFGECSMAAGRRVLAMRAPISTLLCHAFLLRAPHAEACAGKGMLAAHKILCGSNQVRERIAKASGITQGETPWHGPKNRQLPLAGDVLTQLAPGMNLEGYTPAPEWKAEAPLAESTGNEPRFIFCMGDALTPRSGVHVVIRAMAAIWQRRDLPRWEVRAAGGGPRFQEVLEEAESLGVQSRLCLLNEQPLHQLLHSSHAWIAPGSAPDELPDTLGAGLAAHLPVICGQGDLHNQRLKAAPAAACMFEENNPQSLAEAMINIMTNNDLRRNIVQAGDALRPSLGLDAFADSVCARHEAWCAELGWLEQSAHASIDQDKEQP